MFVLTNPNFMYMLHYEKPVMREDMVECLEKSDRIARLRAKSLLVMAVISYSIVILEYILLRWDLAMHGFAALVVFNIFALSWIFYLNRRQRKLFSDMNQRLKDEKQNALQQ